MIETHIHRDTLGAFDKGKVVWDSCCRWNPRAKESAETRAPVHPGWLKTGFKARIKLRNWNICQVCHEEWSTFRELRTDQTSSNIRVGIARSWSQEVESQVVFRSPTCSRDTSGLVSHLIVVYKSLYYILLDSWHLSYITTSKTTVVPVSSKRPTIMLLQVSPAVLSAWYNRTTPCPPPKKKTLGHLKRENCV